MTLEELQAEVARLSGELTAVTANNKKLVGELRQAKKGSEIDPADVERLETELETVKGQLKDATKAATTATKQAEEASKALESERGYTSSLLVDGGLASALTEAGVSPSLFKAAQALLKTSAKIEVQADDTGARRALVDGKPLGEFVKGWSASDEGKAFVVAPGHSGGGAPGGSGKSGAVNPFAKDGWNMTAQAALYKENPTQAKAMAAEAGVTL